MDKSEIQEMPEGMTSEEVDALIMGDEESDSDITPEDNEDINKSGPAEESVAEDEESGQEEQEQESEETSGDEEKENVDPKDAVIGDFRRKNRELEIEKARLEGRLEAMAEVQGKVKEPVVEKSPLDKAKADYIEEVGDLEGFTMSVELYEQQEAWKEEQAQKKTETNTRTTMEQRANQLADTEFSAEKLGAGLDYRSVVIPGQKLLDEADLLKIKIVSKRDGVEAALRKTYDLCKDALLNSDTEDSKALKLAVKAQKATKPKKKTQTKQKPMTSEDIDRLTTEDDDETGESENVPHSQRLSNFIFDDSLHE